MSDPLSQAGMKGLGIGLQTTSQIMQAGLIGSTARAEYELAQMKASSLQFAADLNESNAALAKLMAERELEADLFYAEHFMAVGEIDSLEIERQAQRIRTDIYGEGATAIDTYELQTAKRNVAMTGTAYQQLENMLNEIENNVTDLEYEKDLAQTKTLMEATMQAGAAKIEARSEYIEGLMRVSALRAQAAEQRASAIATIASAELRKSAGKQQQIAGYAMAGTTLLGGITDIYQKFGQPAVSAAPSIGKFRTPSLLQ